MEKEKHTVPESFHILKQTNQLRGLLTFIRDSNTKRDDFIFYSNRIIRLLIEEALNLLPFNEKVVTTPTNAEYQGLEFCDKVCGVSIMRAGESMENGLREVLKSVRIGKILIQRDPETHNSHHYYTKLPKDIASRHVLLLDPLLATGGSAIHAVKVLLENGVKEENIVFVNLIACYEGAENFYSKYPNIKVVTATIDPILNDDKYIVPGCGDFGDRYFGTD